MTVRNTQRREAHRAAVSQGHPPCHWCGQEIDYEADHRNPLAFQVDHVMPLSKGGPEVDTLDNCVPSHRACNRAKSDKVAYRAGITFVTDRAWW